MKDKLIDLITIGFTRACVKEAAGKKVDQAREIADVLIANGVIVPPTSTPERWEKNMEFLHMGGFGDTSNPETLLNYWKAQASAGYPYATENVKYFEEMIGRERSNQ